MSLTPSDFGHVYNGFNSPVCPDIDCGKFCAPLNQGEPVCCTTKHAIPFVDKAEFKYLKSQTDMWTKLKPFDDISKKLIQEHAPQCVAIECNGARHCERDNRSIACRAFPFFPFLNRKREILGVSIYWGFKDRCWVMSHLKYVDATYIKELITSYAYLFSKDEDEEEAFFQQSTEMRRLYSRKGWPIPILSEDAEPFHILPKSKELTPIQHSQLEKYYPFDSMNNYRKEVKYLDGDASNLSLTP